MPGSPRVERAANIRIQHPNLSTEDAMKLGESFVLMLIQ